MERVQVGRGLWGWGLEIGKKRVCAPGYVSALVMVCGGMIVVGV
jgi:hypothetical protein